MSHIGLFSITLGYALKKRLRITDLNNTSALFMITKNVVNNLLNIFLLKERYYFYKITKIQFLLKI